MFSAKSKATQSGCRPQSLFSKQTLYVCGQGTLRVYQDILRLEREDRDISVRINLLLWPFVLLLRPFIVLMILVIMHQHGFVDICLSWSGGVGIHAADALWKR